MARWNDTTPEYRIAQCRTDGPNLFLGHGPRDDEVAHKAGLKFLGVAISNTDGEVHIWEVQPLKEINTPKDEDTSAYNDFGKF